MFMCDITKTPPNAHNIVYIELFLFANGDVSIRFSGKDDNVVLELVMALVSVVQLLSFNGTICGTPNALYTVNHVKCVGWSDCNVIS